MDDPKHHDKDSLPLFADQEFPDQPVLPPQPEIEEAETEALPAELFAISSEADKILVELPVIQPEIEEAETEAPPVEAFAASEPEAVSEIEEAETEAPPVEAFAAPEPEAVSEIEEAETEAPPVEAYAPPKPKKTKTGAPAPVSEKAEPETPPASCPVDVPTPAVYSYEGIPLSSFGKYLRELRNRNNLQIFDLAESTKIRSTYIESIEEEDYDNLPPPVYVLAYIKTIGDFYRLPESIMTHLTAEVRQRLEYEAPEDPSKTIIDEEESEENAILMRKYLMIGGGVLVVVIFLLAWLIVALMPDQPPPEEVPLSLEPRSEEQLLQLHPEPVLELRELPVSAN